MDAEEFKRRFLPLHIRLYRTAFRLMGNAMDAEDMDNHATMNIAQYVSLTGLSRTAATLELQAFRNDPESGITYEGSRTHKVYVRRK